MDPLLAVAGVVKERAKHRSRIMEAKAVSI